MSEGIVGWGLCWVFDLRSRTRLRGCESIKAVGWCEERTPTLPSIVTDHPTKYPIHLIEALTDQSQNTLYGYHVKHSI